MNFRENSKMVERRISVLRNRLTRLSGSLPFVLDLVTVIRGQDKKGHDFEMTALLAGRGKLVVLYDRDGIIYKNERLARDFRLASRVEFETPATGVLENVQGLCAKVLLLGCVSDPS
jgi:hypothetical protein